MTDDEARAQARARFRASINDGSVEIDDDAKVAHLDEPDTGVEGWAWVQIWALIEPKR